MGIRSPGIFMLAVSGYALFVHGLFSGRPYSPGSTVSFRSHNTPPVVQIIEPEKNSVYPLNSTVRYSISVSDSEDGESGFDEIPIDKIFLEIRFVKGTPDSWDADKAFAEKEPSGLSLLKNSGCFTCHQFNSKLIGPSMRDVADRYSDPPGQRDILANHITQGSKGMWGESVMPAHPDITFEEAGRIVDWILEHGANRNLDYSVGKEGSFWLHLPADTTHGFFVLRATYTDKGIRGRMIDGMSGEDFAIVKYR